MSVKSSKIMGLAGVLLILVSSVAFVGGAAAVDYTKDYSGDAAVHVSEMFDSSEDLATVYADVTPVDDMNTSSDTDTTTDVRFVVQGVNESAASNSTELVNETRTISEGSLESFTYEPTDANNTEYNSYYLHVESVTDSESDRINSTDAGTTIYTSGGGGPLGGGSSSTMVIAGVVIVGYLYVRD